jgi:aspartate kinase
MRTAILKFGGASVKTAESFALISQIIALRQKCFDRVVVAISAMGNTTDDLISLAQRVHPNPPKREMDMLLSVGERISMSLLAMALDRLGIKAQSFTGSQSGIITSHEHAEAKIVDVKPKRLIEALNKNFVVIVAGFQGMSLQGEITTLGRGGTDTTAVALGVALGAQRVEFYKDVDGIFDQDPHLNPAAKKRDHLDYDQALEILNKGSGVLHDRCVLLAKKNGLTLQVLPFLGFESEDEVPHLGTLISGSKRPLPTLCAVDLAKPTYE